MAITADHVIRRTRRAAEANGLDVAGIRKQLDRTFRQARKSAGAAADRSFHATDRYVHRHPWTAVAFAAGAVAVAGLAVANLIRRRSRPRRWFDLGR